ncbi:conserved hypothetical protein [Histoplasma capsulatum G186AR]|uniref:Uncharacterized protein n=2 Tax=Ajellomyces capsulatus TaxID=5037 RepID=C0NY24_AJECG|nr:uncharacterized protein HCBG_07818 [Histoplasma capsulatum G186AR]EEH03692.1 conserved hypothetical protein [Histoplasma capsulatum G186AR]
MPRKPQREECHRDRRYLDWTPQLCVSVYQFFSLLTNMRLANNMRFAGASGLGKAFVHRFVEAGAYVTFGDVNEEAGFKLAAELTGKARFVRCDVRSWEEQVCLFEAAVANSPRLSCDIVIANAGIPGPDGLFAGEDPSLPPTRPDTTIFDVNLTGTIYTTKLAIHYFRRQSLEPGRDRCLILIGSIAGYLDLPGSATYSMSKFGVRALMRSLRRNAWVDSIRVNLVSPSYIITPAYTEEIIAFFESKGVKFASESDACKAILRIASDTTVNGRSIAVVSKEDCAGGYFDLAEDDFPEGSKLYDLQNVATNVGSRT